MAYDDAQEELNVNDLSLMVLLAVLVFRSTPSII